MDLSLLLAAAEHAAEGAAEHAGAEHHKSETPFFVAGAVLVAFAIIISVIGFKKPDFPANDGAARGVMALSVVLMLGALSTAIYVAW